MKEKAERRGLASAQVTIHRVPVSRSILVSGLLNDTTHEAIKAYFERRSSKGGPVETVRFKPKSGQAVVVFQDSAGKNTNFS